MESTRVWVSRHPRVWKQLCISLRVLHTICCVKSICVSNNCDKVRHRVAWRVCSTPEISATCIDVCCYYLFLCLLMLVWLTFERVYSNKPIYNCMHPINRIDCNQVPGFTQERTLHQSNSLWHCLAFQMSRCTTALQLVGRKLMWWRVDNHRERWHKQGLIWMYHTSAANWMAAACPAYTVHVAGRTAQSLTLTRARETSHLNTL